MATSSVDLWGVIAAEAAGESPLWGDALRPRGEWELEPVFSPLLPRPQFAVGLETIYEGYLLHFGRSRLFGPDDRHTSLLLGDYLYAHGLVRVAAWQEVDAVADLAALISLCAQLRADGAEGDGAAWAASAALLGEGPLLATREPRALLAAAGAAAGAAEVERAVALHERRVL